MAEVPGDLLYELLKRMHADLTAVKREMADAKREAQAIRSHMIGLQQDISNIYAMMGSKGAAPDPADRHLDLTEPAE